MTEQAEEWGPWIDHNGKGCPCLGLYVQAEWECWRSGDRYKAGERGLTEALITRELAEHAGWHWAERFGKLYVHPTSKKRGRLDGGFVRYRLRKPRALFELRKLAEALLLREDA